MPLPAPPSQTTPPTPPQRSDPANFAVRGDGFLAWIVTWFNELLLLIPWIRDAAAICESAAQAVNVSAWISGTTYAVGENRYDTTNFLTYRRKTAGAGTTRPGLDGTNWQLLTGFGDVDLASTQTLTNKTLGTGSVWDGQAIPVDHGGTGAATAADAFNALKQAASATATGVVELATAAEVAAGTDNTRAMTPAALRGGAIQSMVRVNTQNGHGSTNTFIRRFTTVVTNVGADISYADSASLGGSFTINNAGVYAISYTDSFNGAGNMGVSLNSSQLTTDIISITASSRLTECGTSAANSRSTCGTTLYLPAGSVIRAHTNGGGAGTLPAVTQFTITRVA